MFREKVFCPSILHLQQKAIALEIHKGLQGIESKPLDFLTLPKKPKEVTQPASRGSGRFNYAQALICMAGSYLGGSLAKIVTYSFLENNSSLTEFAKHNFAELAFFPGGLIFGLVIPLEISRRAKHKSWSDLWRNINS